MYANIINCKYPQKMYGRTLKFEILKLPLAIEYIQILKNSASLSNFI